MRTGGEPGRHRPLGPAHLAYEMKKRREGYYVVVQFTGEPATVAALDRILAADEVLRHKVIRLPETRAG